MLREHDIKCGCFDRGKAGWLTEPGIADHHMNRTHEGCIKPHENCINPTAENLVGCRGR